MAYEDFKDFSRINDFDKALCKKVFNIQKNQKIDEYKHRFVSILYNFFDKNYNKN